MKRTIAAFFVLLVIAGTGRGLPDAAQAQAPDIEGVYRQFVAALNRGDVTTALSYMTDDVQLQGTPGCLLSPCVGKAAVRRDLELDVAGQLQIQFIATIQVSGNTLRASTAHRAAPLQAAGFSRVLITDIVTFEGGKISRLVFEPVLSDPDTAAFVRLLTSGPPVPTAAAVQPAPAPSVRPPSTGDGGLSD